ncbi:unnamed protein product, partial [Durusdinium trenchii]
MSAEVIRAVKAAQSSSEVELLLAPELARWARQPKLATPVLKSTGRNALPAVLWMLRSSLRPNVIHFNAAVAACEEADAWPSALELLRQMLQHSVQGSVLSFNRTMAAMSSEWRKSLALLEEMPSHQVAPCATTDGR